MLQEFNHVRLVCFEDFCRYYLGWSRGRKQCDFIYFPKSLLEDIRKFKRNTGRYENHL